MPTTQWIVTPSIAYDTLCFLNTLTGDPYYTPLYPEEYAYWAPRLTPEAQAALAELKRAIKDEGKGIISARLCYTFSLIPDLTLDTLLATLAAPQALHDAYQQSREYREDDWQALASQMANLRTILVCLRERGFESYWQEHILPQIAPSVATLRTTLPAYDILPQVERALGYALGTDEVTTYLIHFTRPHGISLTGYRFITSPKWPAEITIRTSIHEMMHPPFDLHDSDLRRQIEALKQDAFLMSRFVGHNPSFGYNTLVGLIEEGCVQALDQIISEHFGIARDPHTRWEESDEGLHVFAVALYALMRRDNYGAGEHQGTFQDYLSQALLTDLQPGQIERVYTDFYRARS